MRKLNAIKIDVEGYELNVLRGAEMTIKKSKPLLYLEIDEKKLNRFEASTVKLFSFLKDLNYKVIDPQTRIVYTQEPIGHTDVFAIHNG